MVKRKLIYQIYPTAIGSLQDITDKIPLIAKLQPDYIWLSPIFLSPWVDGGYDVADYCKIDPRFGTMSDFRKLVSVAKKYSIGILLDLVLNHTSSEHIWFKKSEQHDPWYKDYYVWVDKPLNWNSFFGGPAFDYSETRGKYYLHLYDRAQPDLNFGNPRVIREFKNIIQFWTDHDVAGFRVDSANVLAEDALRFGVLPRLPGFFNYYQTKETIAVLEKLLGGTKLFTIAEPVGGEFMSRARFRELTRKAFDASFNIGTLDAADTFFSIKDRFYPIKYRNWFRQLAKWCREETFSLALESHDTPRSPSRFGANPKTLAMMQFLLPCNFPCVYQGQEIGTVNPKLSNNINDYRGVQSRMIYRRLRKEGQTKRQAMKQVKLSSRDNARQPIDWGEYVLQESDDKSVLQFYRKLIELWRNDSVLINGDFHVRKTTSKGVFDFERCYGGEKYSVHLDFSGKTKSYCKKLNDEVVIANR